MFSDIMNFIMGNDISKIIKWLVTIFKLNMAAKKVIE